MRGTNINKERKDIVDSRYPTCLSELGETQGDLKKNYECAKGYSRSSIPNSFLTLGIFEEANLKKELHRFIVDRRYWIYFRHRKGNIFFRMNNLIKFLTLINTHKLGH
jgi:hypothetical protein